MLAEDARRALTAMALLFGGMLDGQQAEVRLDVDGDPPLEHTFVGFPMCGAPYRLAVRRPDGVFVYVPLYGDG